MIFPAGTSYRDACIKGPAPFLIFIFRTGPYPILEPSAELYPARISFEGGHRNVSTCCQQSFFGILLNGFLSASVCFSNLSYGLLAKSSPATTEAMESLPAVAGRLFCWKIRPGRLSLPSGDYEFTSIPGRVQFPFLLRPCSRYPNSRKCVHTPLT